MTLIFLVALIVFAVSSFEFHRVKLPWLYCQWREWPLAPVYPTSVYWIIRFGGDAVVLS